MPNSNQSISFDSARAAVPVSSVPLLDVGRGNQPIKSEIMQLFSEIYDSGRFIGGPHCQHLEQAVATTCESQFAVGCASGSDALLLALMAIGLQPGDEVILPSFTFFATASAVTRLDGVPVFIDIDPQTFNLDPELIEGLINERTKAIIPVHLFGQCCNMQPILEVARQHNLEVIEDCAQSIGASYKDRQAGSMGRIGCLSFYPTKNLGGMGDGGMLTTNSSDMADRIRLLANHGMRPRYYHQEVGINSRLDSMQAAVLGVKMQYVNDYGQMRQRNADHYQKLMIDAGLADHVVLPAGTTLSTRPTESRHVWNQYTIRVPGGLRDSVRQQLSDRNIGSEIYYPIPLHRQACFKSLNVAPGSLVETDRAAGEVLALPIFPELTEREQEYVVSSLSEIMKSQRYRMAS